MKRFWGFTITLVMFFSAFTCFAESNVEVRDAYIFEGKTYIELYADSATYEKYFVDAESEINTNDLYLERGVKLVSSNESALFTIHKDGSLGFHFTNLTADSKLETNVIAFGAGAYMEAIVTADSILLPNNDVEEEKVTAGLSLEEGFLALFTSEGENHFCVKFKSKFGDEKLPLEKVTANLPDPVEQSNEYIEFDDEGNLIFQGVKFVPVALSNERYGGIPQDQEYYDDFFFLDGNILKLSADMDFNTVFMIKNLVPYVLHFEEGATTFKNVVIGRGEIDALLLEDGSYILPDKIERSVQTNESFESLYILFTEQGFHGFLKVYSADW